MTAESLAARSESGSRQPEARTKAVACVFCRRRLADEYYFTCRRCEESYCYIHMSRHVPSRCGRRLPLEVPGPFLVARARRSYSSANV
jgi:hypothetical protein